MQRLATFSSCLLLLMFTGINGQGSQCKDGWFGDKCQYQCHCLNNLICDKVTGECPIVCDRKWFGPQCQYLDAAYNIRSPLTDGIESTCLDGTGLSQHFQMSDDLRFTWMRFVTNRPGLFDRVNITLLSWFGEKVTPKSSLTKINSSDTVLYLYGEIEDRFKTIRLDFDSPETRQSFCSMQVSSGRNVAIKQKASQSTTWLAGGAEKAVDGQSTQRWEQGSCTHTTKEDSPYWTLNLSLPVTVNMYTILNRIDPDLLCRLRYFRLETYFGSTKVQHYDETDPVDQNSYDVYSLDTSVITSVKLTISKYFWPNYQFDCSDGIPKLNFCELQIFGDVVCPPGKWGRDCEKDCYYCQHSCSQSDSCFVSTGMCISCKAGFYGAKCQEECPDGQWGVDCLNRCDNCLNGKCNKTSGECLSECSTGYKMPFCVEECDAGFHGDNCTLSCPANCQDNICNNVDGTCVECVTGYQGPECNQGYQMAFVSSPSAGIHFPFTEELTMRCSLVDVSSALSKALGLLQDSASTKSVIRHVTSIIITKGGSHVASITQYDPAQPWMDFGLLEVTGDISGVSNKDAFLELSWMFPTLSQAGGYACEINAVDAFGHTLIHSQPLEVKDLPFTMTEVGNYILEDRRVNRQLNESLADLEKKYDLLEKKVLALQQSG